MSKKSDNRTAEARAGSLQRRVMPPTEQKVSAMGMWMDNAFEPGKFILVDCGYGNHPRARSNADRLLKALGAKGKKGYVEVVANCRVLVRIPHAKKEILARFKGISTGAGYCWTTHCYDRKGPQFALKYAA